MLIERRFQDTLATRLRSDFKVLEDITLHAGFEYETAATPTKTHEPGLAESESVQLGVGGTFRLSERLALTSSFIWHQFADVRVEDSIQAPTQNGDYTDRRLYLTVDLEITL